jgi:hypothetical protein
MDVIANRARATVSAVIVRLDRTIQYPAALRVSTAGACDYWMPAFAGMTMNAAMTNKRTTGN